MKKIKYALSAAALSAAMMLGLAAPAAAQSADRGGQNNIDNSQTSVDIGDKYSVNGDCSGIFVTDIEQDQELDQEQKTEQDQEQTQGLQLFGGDQNQSQSSSSNQSGSNSQNAQGPTFSPDCSRVTNVTNVTEVAAAAEEAEEAQVDAPEGGVKAGVGGSAGSAAMPLAGFGSSLAGAGYGMLRLRKRNL